MSLNQLFIFKIQIYKICNLGLLLFDKKNMM